MLIIIVSIFCIAHVGWKYISVRRLDVQYAKANWNC